MPKRIIVILIGAFSLLMFFLKALDSNYRRHLPERIIIISIGAFFLFMFFLMRSGRFRSWFIAKPVPGLMSGPMSYLSLVVGAEFILLALIPVLPNNQLYNLLLNLILFGGPFLGFYWAANPPRWLQPRWVRWLSDEYGYCPPHSCSRSTRHATRELGKPNSPATRSAKMDRRCLSAAQNRNRSQLAHV